MPMARWQSLDAKQPDSRALVVGRTAPTPGSVATRFLWNEIESSLATALNKVSPAAVADGLGQQRLDFLRGDRSREGSPFRRRGSVLGDIINSGMAFSGSPTLGIPDADYRIFESTNRNRVKTLFVGANDGMLHAFNTENGDELFGYIPSWLGPKLSALTNPSYNVSGHQSYVDGSPVVNEAKVGNDWKTVLVSGTGGGGQGVFALDVTNPAAFDASKVMWEFSDRDDPDLGNVVGKPQILKFRTSAESATPAVYKWFAVVPSGVNNYVNDGNFSSTGAPALFILDLAKPAGTAWSLGSNYFKVALPVDSTIRATTPTGLVNFNATLGLAGEVEYAYMGDLYGNLWKFDFSLHGSSEWNFNELNARSTTPMFTARDSLTRVQPISVEPTLLNGPNGTTLLLFGTGRYFESVDNVVNSTTQPQSLYLIFDNNLSGAGGRIAGRGRLQQRVANALTGTVTNPDFVFGRPSSDTDVTQRAGWYFDFPLSGERLISRVNTVGNQAVFGSVVPPEAQAGSCGTGSGNQYVVPVNPGTGVGGFSKSQIGILGEPLIVELVSAITPARVDNTGRGIKRTPSKVILTGSTGTSSLSGVVINDETVGRLSWRMISNYQELRNAP